MASTRPTTGAGFSPHASHPVRLSLLSDFDLVVDGTHCEVPTSAQRLIAYLALHSRPQPRASVAASLWIDLPDERAAANLRASLWKLRDVRERVIAVRANQLSLSAQVEVDVVSISRVARRLLEASRPVNGADDGALPVAEVSYPDLDLLTLDLLPGWDEDWILLERERFRQLRVHAIEALCAQLCASGRHAEAVEAGLAAVAADPLRESAQRVLIKAHLAEGNVVDARRQFDAFCRLLRESLGVDPSPELQQLVAVRSRDGRGGGAGIGDRAPTGHERLERG